ncbi:AAA family ATPase [Anabaena azotica]|uniref:AAA family ATPase n=1 Tax=Anabaena azotica TaxID=197653 RepID=UPI0039A554A5
MAKNICFEPGDRLSLITGDNGLGKTFLLECSWWALTGHWAGLPAYPNQIFTKYFSNINRTFSIRIGLER